MHPSESPPTSGTFHNGAHHISFRIYYEDTDAGGIVYHANYLRFAERARTEALRACGIGQSQLRADHGVGFVVRHCTLDFRRPARLDDIVTVETSITEIGKTRFNLLQRVRREKEELAEITVVIVMVDAQGKPMRVPEALLAAMTQKLHAPGTS